jgi:hypothetical protein
MSNDFPICDCCGQEMKLVKSGHVRTHKGSKCRLRRFICFFGTIKTIYANGSFDDEVIPEIVKDDVKKLYKQQEDYNKDF